MTKKLTIIVPAGWDRDACVLWETNQRVEAIQRTMTCINAFAQKNPSLVIQAAYYLFLLDDYRRAAALLENLLTATPEHFEALLNLAVCYSRLCRWAESVELSRRALEIAPDNLAALDVMANCLHQLQRYEESSAVGSRALELKDRACDTAAAKVWALPKGRPQDFARQPGKRNVIAYSLWGAAPAFLRGALRNLLLAPDMYPGWTLLFNVDKSVPEEFIGLIEKLGGEVVMHSDNQTLREKLCWRFQVANSSGVGYFLVRDADSVINVREVQAVQAWLASDKWFHVMRDWWTHTDLILAGMWGGVAGVLPGLAGMLATYRPPVLETPNIDQWFLRDKVWAYVRQSCLAHDRCFHPTGALPFPGTILADELHIGQDEYAAHGAKQELFLHPWIRAYPCLGQLRFNPT